MYSVVFTTEARRSQRSTYLSQSPQRAQRFLSLQSPLSFSPVFRQAPDDFRTTAKFAILPKSSGTMQNTHPSGQPGEGLRDHHLPCMGANLLLGSSDLSSMASKWYDLESSPFAETFQTIILADRRQRFH